LSTFSDPGAAQHEAEAVCVFFQSHTLGAFRVGWKLPVRKPEDRVEGRHDQVAQAHIVARAALDHADDFRVARYLVALLEQTDRHLGAVGHAREAAAEDAARVAVTELGPVGFDRGSSLRRHERLGDERGLDLVAQLGHLRRAVHVGAQVLEVQRVLQLVRPRKRPDVGFAPLEPRRLVSDSRSDLVAAPAEVRGLHLRLRKIVENTASLPL
jgi:hypothetical protein